MLITVFTPTYNRSKLLQTLYSSLISQTDNRFEWLIVDDGSTDQTQEMVTGWIEEEKIRIRYIKQSNSGKWKGFNNGVEHAQGELFFCVDSDDYLVCDAVEKIFSCWEMTDSERSAGLIAYKADKKGRRLGDAFPDGLSWTDTYSLGRRYRCWGEWSLVYRTDLLKKNPFPNTQDFFLPECIVYDKIAQTHKMFLLPEVLTICEYQSDGLTRQYFKLMGQNPTGFQIYYQQRIDMALGLKERIAYALRYQGFRSISKNKKYRYVGRHALLVAFMRPVGLFIKLYYRIKMKDI